MNSVILQDFHLVKPGFFLINLWLNLMFHAIDFIHDIIIDEADWIKYQVKSNKLIR